MRLVEVENKVGQVTLMSCNCPRNLTASRGSTFGSDELFVAAPGEPREKAWFFYVKDTHHEEILGLIEEKEDNITFGKSGFSQRAKHPAAVVITEKLACLDWLGLPNR